MRGGNSVEGKGNSVCPICYCFPILKKSVSPLSFQLLCLISLLCLTVSSRTIEAVWTKSMSTSFLILLLSLTVRLLNIHHDFEVCWRFDKQPFIYYSVQFSCSVVSDSLQPRESQHTRPPCPSPTPGVYSNSCSSSRWCHPAISSSVIPFSSCPQSLSASGSFPMSQLFAWGGQSIYCYRVFKFIKCLSKSKLNILHFSYNLFMWYTKIIGFLVIYHPKLLERSSPLFSRPHAAPSGMLNLSSLTRDQTCAPSIRNTILTTRLPGKPQDNPFLIVVSFLHFFF